MRCRYSGRAAYCAVFCFTSGPFRSAIANPLRMRSQRSDSAAATGFCTSGAGLAFGFSTITTGGGGGLTVGLAATGGVGGGEGAGGGGTAAGGAGTATGSGAGSSTGVAVGPSAHACSAITRSGRSLFKTGSSTRESPQILALDQKRAYRGIC